MSTLSALTLAAVALAAEPITPTALQDALQVPPRGESAEALALRIRAAFPKEQDLKLGGHLVEKDAVAFVLEVPAEPSPRVTGMVDHGRGLDLVKIGETGLWARVESIPTDTKFAYAFTVGGKTFGGKVVEMPDWSYPPESKERPGVTYSEYIAFKVAGATYPGAHSGWIYAPSAYDPTKPAALLVFQDGDAYKAEHVGRVVDNLISEGAMPVTILVGINPGLDEDGRSNRSVEYDTLSDRYATFLDREVLPLVRERFKISDDPAKHAIIGASSGGICAFTVAWHRPDLFGRVGSQIGSFTNIRGGDAYPDLIAKADRKPIKVLLTDGTNDLINKHGDWWQANEAMFAALSDKGYDVHFHKDRGFHAYWTCGRQLPDALRWLWADGAKSAR